VLSSRPADSTPTLTRADLEALSTTLQQIETHLPALANVRHATTRLKTGDRVRLDASNGRVVKIASQD
jgi:hypothetical protein